MIMNSAFLLNLSYFLYYVYLNFHSFGFILLPFSFDKSQRDEIFVPAIHVIVVNYVGGIQLFIFQIPVLSLPMRSIIPSFLST
jgi:hypothetical protein